METDLVGHFMHYPSRHRDYTDNPDDVPSPHRLSFHWADYLVFGLFLALYIGIGVYQAIYNAYFAKKQEDTDEFLVGSRSMSVVPVALSLLGAFLSAILILGTPAEIYTEGVQYWMYVWGQMLSCVLATLLFVPLMYPLRLTSSYEYLELRFGSVAAKLTGTLILIVMQLLYIGVALYSPATALYAVTGFEEWLNILIGGIVAIIYSALGGMKASVWTSAVQTVLMAAGVLAVTIKLIPYYVLDRLGYPTVPGIFLACLFSGALSSVSSSLGALAAVTWEDILKRKLTHLSVSRQTLITKLLVVMYGGIGIGMAFMCQRLGGTVLQMSLSFTGAASGPLLGLFLLGACFPCANWIGAVVGGLLGLAFPLWISAGAYDLDVFSPELPLVTHNCTNFTEIIPTAFPPTADEITGLDRLYLVSYLWFSPIGTFTVVVVGLIVSVITGFEDPQEVHEKYHLPLFDRLFCCLPNQSLYILRCKYDKYDADRAAAEEVEQAHANGKVGEEQNYEATMRSMGDYKSDYTNVAYDNDNIVTSYKKTDFESSAF